MKNKKQFILLYVISMFISSCEQPTECKYIEVEVEKEVIVDREVEVVVEVETLVDNIILTESIIYVEKEVYIMSEEEIVIAVDPITEYDNYVTRESKVYGVTADGFEEIPFITGLFKLDDV